MSYGGRYFRLALKLGSIINALPKTNGKSFQECDSDEKSRMLLELAWKEMTGVTYTDQWWDENKMYY